VREFSSAVTTDDDVNVLEGHGFVLDGVEFRCLGQLSMLDLSDLARRVQAAPGYDPDNPVTDPGQPGYVEPAVAAGIMAGFSDSLQMALGDAEYSRFLRHCRSHKTPDSVTVEIMQDINDAAQRGVEERSGRPTLKPSPSGNGPGATDERTARVLNFTSGEVRFVGLPGEPPPHPEPLRPAAGQVIPPGLAGKQPARTTTTRLGAEETKPRARRSRAG
jgi:hypothetical protein